MVVKGYGMGKVTRYREKERREKKALWVWVLDLVFNMELGYGMWDMGFGHILAYGNSMG